MANKRIIVGITGASGAIYGLRLLEILKAHGGVETHLIMSPSSEITLKLSNNSVSVLLGATPETTLEFEDFCSARCAKDLLNPIHNG